MVRYQDIYPEQPLQKSADLDHPTASSLVSLEYFEAEPAGMPTRVFDQHHIVINLREEPQRVHNIRNGELRDFTLHLHEIVVTPAGVESGWRWFVKSKVIIITLEPERLANFAQNELGILLTETQLQSLPQFIDPDLTQAAIMLLDALNSKIGSAVMFESLARVFLTKLILKYGLERKDVTAFSKSFTAQHYKRVLDYVAQHYNGEIGLEKMAREAGLSTYHFARQFKKTIGKSPHQFLMSYRIEQAKKHLRNSDQALIDVALGCGFSDQPHFTRVFRQFEGMTPRQFRTSRQ